MEKDLAKEMQSVIDHLTSVATYAGLAFGDFADALSAGAAHYLPEREDAKTMAGVLSEIMSDACDILIMAERALTKIEEENKEDEKNEI